MYSDANYEQLSETPNEVHVLVNPANYVPHRHSEGPEGEKLATFLSLPSDMIILPESHGHYHSQQHHAHKRHHTFNSP